MSDQTNLYMRLGLLLALLLLPACVYAQERVSVSGRIVNEKGEAVEYVQVGVSKRGIGTVSSVDGRFEINVPADTLEFHHVSYETGFYPVSGPREDVLIVLKESELPPAVSSTAMRGRSICSGPGRRFRGLRVDFPSRGK